jgi:hypothetical protein
LVRPRSGPLDIGGRVPIAERVPRGRQKIKPVHPDHFGEFFFTAPAGPGRVVMQGRAGIDRQERDESGPASIAHGAGRGQRQGCDKITWHKRRIARYGLQRSCINENRPFDQS